MAREDPSVQPPRSTIHHPLFTNRRRRLRSRRVLGPSIPTGLRQIRCNPVGVGARGGHFQGSSQCSQTLRSMARTPLGFGWLSYNPIMRLPRTGRAGVTLLETLIVIAIIAVLSAIAYSVLVGVRGAARRSTCVSNLHQVGLAMALYRSDWDDQNPKDSVLDGPPKQRLAWTLLAQYAKVNGIFRCPDEAGTSLDSLGYIYRSGPRTLGDKERTALGLGPSSVTAYCMEHLKRKVVQGAFDYVEYELGEDKRYVGRFQVLRHDSSASAVDAKQVETWVSDGTRWYPLDQVPNGLNTFVRTERFPDEPWPPEFQY